MSSVGTERVSRAEAELRVVVNELGQRLTETDGREVPRNGAQHRAHVSSAGHIVGIMSTSWDWMSTMSRRAVGVGRRERGKNEFCSHASVLTFTRTTYNRSLKRNTRNLRSA